MKKQGLKIFLSYGHDQNTQLVELIKDDLEKRGHDVWFDKSEIKTGDDWRRSITEGLTSSDKVLSFLSKYSVRDPGVCRDEIAIAIGVKGGNIQTILVENEADVKPPVNISHLQWLDMNNWKTFFEQGGRIWEDWYAEKLAQIIRVVESDESRRFAGEIDTLAKVLQPMQAQARINNLLNHSFFGREWLFSKVEDWRNAYSNNSRVFVLLADAGAGKSSFTAHFAHIYGDVVVAAHFCEWNKPSHSDPRSIVKSLAFQLATKFPDYRKYLLTLSGIDALEQQSAAELFTALIANPLSFCIDGGRRRYIILIDAVDEANTQNNQNELISLIADEFHLTPHWLSLVITSRPENDILARLSKFNPCYLNAEVSDNQKDIQLFLSTKLSMQPESLREKAIESILMKSRGNFLYAVEICSDILNGLVNIAEPDAFPSGMGALFFNSFTRKFKNLDYGRDIAPVLEILVSAMEPISSDLVCRLLGIKKRQLNDILLRIGSFFPVTEGTIQPFHKSLIDWLGNPSASERFYIDLEDAEKTTAQAHEGILEELFNDTDSLKNASGYVTKFALVHLYKAGMNKELQKRLLYIFDADNSVYEFAEPMVDALADWVVRNKAADKEQVLDGIFDTLSKKSINKQRLSTYFFSKGDEFQNIGFSRWALKYCIKDQCISEELVSLNPGNVEFLYDLAMSYNNAGFLYKNIGQGAQSLKYFDKSLKVMEKVIAGEPDRTDYRIGLGNSYGNVGALYADTGQVSKALEYTKRSLEIYEELEKSQSHEEDIHFAISMTLFNLGKLYELKNQRPKALEYFEKSLKVIQELLAFNPEKTMYLRHLCSLHTSFAVIYTMMGMGMKALESFNTSLSILESILEKEPDRTDFRYDRVVVNNLSGMLYKDMGQGLKALELLEKSVTEIDELVKQEPGRTDFCQNYAMTCVNLGNIYKDRGMSLRALEILKNAMQLIEELRDHEPERTDWQRGLASIYDSLGLIYKSSNEFTKAVEYYKKSLNIRETLAHIEPDRTDFLADLTASYDFMGDMYNSRGEEDTALEYFEKSLKIRRDMLQSDPDRSDIQRALGVSYNKAAYIYKAKGHTSLALRLFEKSVKAFETLVSHDPHRMEYRHQLSLSYNGLGYMLSSLGKDVQALEVYEKALVILRDLSEMESERKDWQVHFAMNHLNISSVCPKADKLLWLEKAESIMEPLIREGETLENLPLLWKRVRKGINELKNQ